MKIKINDKEIELTPEQVKILGEEVKKEKNGLWKPEMGEGYYWIDDDGVVWESPIDRNIWHEGRYSIGNAYKTEEEAKAHVEKLKAIQRVKEYIAENCEVVEDVENADTGKWSVGYNLQRKEFYASFWDSLLFCQLLPPLKTIGNVEKVIAHCEADLKIIWGIK